MKAPNLFRGEVAPRDQLQLTLLALVSAVKDLSPLSTGLIMKVLSPGTPDQGGSPFHSLLGIRATDRSPL